MAPANFAYLQLFWLMLTSQWGVWPVEAAYRAGDGGGGVVERGLWGGLGREGREWQDGGAIVQAWESVQRKTGPHYGARPKSPLVENRKHKRYSLVLTAHTHTHTHTHTHVHAHTQWKLLSFHMKTIEVQKQWCLLNCVPILERVFESFLFSTATLCWYVNTIIHCYYHYY